MFCKNCGAQLAGTKNNCSNCGFPVEKENKEVVPSIIEHTAAPAPNPFVVTPTVVEEPAQPTQPELPVEPTQLQTPVVEQPQEATPEPVANEKPQPSILDQTLNQSAPAPAEKKTEPVAPVVENKVEEEAPTPALQSFPEPVERKPEVQQAEPVKPTPPPAPMPPQQPQAAPQPQPASPQPGNINSKTAFIIGGVFLLAIVIVYVLTNFLKGGSTPVNTYTSTTEKEYAGFVFSIPQNHAASVIGTDFMIDGPDKNYIINIDYSNPYDQYKSYYTLKYNDTTGEAVNIIGGREYLIYRFKDTEEREISEFFTKWDESITIAGVITHRDGSTITISDYESLSLILNAVKKSGTLIQKGDTYDSGKVGYIDFSARKLNFFR